MVMSLMVHNFTEAKIFHSRDFPCAVNISSCTYSYIGQDSLMVGCMLIAEIQTNCPLLLDICRRSCCNQMQENWLGYHEDVCEFVFVFVFLYLYLHIQFLYSLLLISGKLARIL